MIEVMGISKYYGKLCAADRISFKAEAGKVYGFLGPNGAGKSTTMNMMTGCLTADEGTVLIDGADIYRSEKAARRKIGYLPETPPLYPEMTPEEYLGFIADAKGLTAFEKKNSVEYAIEVCGLGGKRGKLIKTLSKGYKQRVGIAGAITGDPELVLLDEPMVGLDPKQTEETCELIESLKKDRTVIISSHILPEIERICDELIIIKKGRLIAKGSLREIADEHIKTGTLELLLKAPIGRVRMLLAGIDEVLSYEITEGDILKIRAEHERGADIRESLYKALREEPNAVLLGMKDISLSLSDVFKKLTEDADEPENEAVFGAGPDAEEDGAEESGEEYSPLFSRKDDE